MAKDLKNLQKTTKEIKHKSVPNARMLRMLSKKFKVYVINEYNTSKLNCKTKEENTNLKHNVTKNHKVDTIEEIQQIHRVLTYKMSNGRRLF